MFAIPKISAKNPNDIEPINIPMFILVVKSPIASPFLCFGISLTARDVVAVEDIELPTATIINYISIFKKVVEIESRYIPNDSIKIPIIIITFPNLS